MGNLSSINFKQTKNSIQVNHNDRSIPPNYLLSREVVLKASGGVEVNKSAQEALELREHMIAKAMNDYLQYRGQKFRAKSYLWSAVVNLKETSTMQDLEKLAKHFKDKYGFQCYQIAIHRDEGHVDERGEICINHHAHLEFVTLDANTGKSLFRKTTPLVLKQIQTDTAQILGMERGEYKNDHIDEQGNLIKGTGRKRIEPRAYAQLMEKEKAKCVVMIKQTKQQEKVIHDFYQFSNNLNALLKTWEGMLDYKEAIKLHIDKVTGLLKEVKTSEKQIKDLQASLENTKTKLRAIEQDKIKLEQTNTALTQENQELKNSQVELETTLIDLVRIFDPQEKQGKKLTIKEAKPLIESVRKQMIAINQGFGDLKLFTQEDYRALRALKEEGLNIEGLKKRIVAIEQKAKTRYEALQEQYKDYLSPNGVQELRQAHTKELETKEQEHGVALKDKEALHAKELKALETQYTAALESVKNKLINDLGALCELAGGGKWNTPSIAKAELEKSINRLKEEARKASKEAKLEEYVNKVYTLLESFREQVINPILEKTQAERGAEIKAIAQWKEDNEIEKAEYRVHLADIIKDLVAGKFPRMNAMAILMGKGVKDAMNPIYFESVAKNKVDILHRVHIDEIETKLSKELKPILDKIETAREWEHKALLGGIKGLENSIGKLAEEFKNSDVYGKRLKTAESDAQYYKNKTSRLTKELEDKIKEIERLTDENAKLRRTDLHLENATQKTKITELESQVGGLQTQRNDLQKERDKLQIELDNAQAKLSEQVNLTEKLKTDLKKALASQQSKGRGFGV
ncbi:coiled-coil domain-containing protein [Helicobacter suis]|uniref:hypothetical protein n=1 Tax=Helicobacter suis TaxID=104628 RepID=UPI0015813477|nr:hypothetical protein [Helicobacter suis]BCD48542.1 hypothetical protein NHP194003_17460 [Helicobacter suis]GFK17211.1 hypothetical protein NHP190033_13870 [Helicobacter suis]